MIGKAGNRRYFLFQNFPEFVQGMRADEKAEQLLFPGQFFFFVGRGGGSQGHFTVILQAVKQPVLAVDLGFLGFPREFQQPFHVLQQLVPLCHFIKNSGFY